jgi:hypothetical protein
LILFTQGLNAFPGASAAQVGSKPLALAGNEKDLPLMKGILGIKAGAERPEKRLSNETPQSGLRPSKPEAPF